MQTIVKRYPDSELQAFKTLINEKLATAREESESLKARLEDLAKQADSEGGHSFGEDSKNHEGREFVTRLYEKQMKKIHELELALGRIANKTFGVDMETGKLISKDRLMVVPTATTDI